MKDNFNSVDLIEVELYDDNETEPRLPSEIIFMVNNLLIINAFLKCVKYYKKKKNFIQKYLFNFLAYII